MEQPLDYIVLVAGVGIVAKIVFDWLKDRRNGRNNRQGTGTKGVPCFTWYESKYAPILCKVGKTVAEVKESVDKIESSCEDIGDIKKRAEHMQEHITQLLNEMKEDRKALMKVLTKLATQGNGRG